MQSGLSKQRERGASLVEFALILPVFAMLLFGMITGGLALNDKQQMTHATREGARYAATVPADQFGADGSDPRWAEVVRDLIVERSVGTLEDSDICVSLVEGSPGTVLSPASEYSTSGSACIAGQTYPVVAGDNGLRVQVTATRPAEIDLIVFGTHSITMDADATAKSESG